MRLRADEAPTGCWKVKPVRSSSIALGGYTPAAGEPYPVGLQIVGPSWRFNGRSAALNSNSCSSTVEITAIDNNPFELDTIDLAPLNGDVDVSVQFEGTTVHGEKVAYAVRLDPAKRWQRVKLPNDFRRVASVRWQQGDCLVNKPHMFDNVRVRPSKR